MRYTRARAGGVYASGSRDPRGIAGLEEGREEGGGRGEVPPKAEKRWLGCSPRAPPPSPSRPSARAPGRPRASACPRPLDRRGRTRPRGASQHSADLRSERVRSPKAEGESEERARRALLNLTPRQHLAGCQRSAFAPPPNASAARGGCAGGLGTRPPDSGARARDRGPGGVPSGGRGGSRVSPLLLPVVLEGGGRFQPCREVPPGREKERARTFSKRGGAYVCVYVWLALSRNFHGERAA